jgi:hypothetical protein
MSLKALIIEIDGEIARLRQARALLAGEAAPKTSAAKGKVVKRVLSPEARQRIALAQKKRWAKAKRAKAAIA